MTRCWENGPLTEDDCSTTCLLQDGHDGPHEWMRDDEIRIKFAEQIGRADELTRQRDAWRNIADRDDKAREFLAESMRRALKHLDALNLDAYFAEAQKETPHEWVRTLMAIHDELRSALNVLDLDYHKT